MQIAAATRLIYKKGTLNIDYKEVLTDPHAQLTKEWKLKTSLEATYKWMKSHDKEYALWKSRILAIADSEDYLSSKEIVEHCDAFVEDLNHSWLVTDSTHLSFRGPSFTSTLSPDKVPHVGGTASGE